MKKESDDDNKAKSFDFVIESLKSEVKVGKKGCNKKGEESAVIKVWEKEKRKEWGIMRAEEENLEEIPEESRNKLE